MLRLLKFCIGSYTLRVIADFREINESDNNMPQSSALYRLQRMSETNNWYLKYKPLQVLFDLFEDT
jgi:hypothetical protein